MKISKTPKDRYIQKQKIHFISFIILISILLSIAELNLILRIMQVHLTNDSTKRVDGIKRNENVLILNLTLRRV
jgi:hypothetical protein